MNYMECILPNKGKHKKIMVLANSRRINMHIAEVNR